MVGREARHDFLVKLTAQFIALNKTQVFISLLTRSLAAVCQLNPVHTTAFYFIVILLSHQNLSFLSGLKCCIQLQVHAIRLVNLMYFYFITFRAINRTIAKGKTVQISAVPTLCHVTWCIQNRDRKYWEGEGRNILNLIYRKSIPVM